MSSKRILCLAIAVVILSAAVIQQTEAGKMKKMIAALVIAKSLKPRFVPIPIPIPFKLKIKKGEKVVPYPVQSYGGMMDYGGGMGGYGGGMMGGYGGGMMGGYD